MFTGTRSQRGFTLGELVAVLSVLAVLAAVGLPKLLDTSAAKAVAASRRVAMDVRFAQRLALTTNQEVGLTVLSATTYRVFLGSAATPATDPLTRQPFDVNVATEFDGNLTVGPVGATITFDTRGRPKTGSAGTITVGGQSLTIYSETGTVRLPGGA